MYSNLFWYVGGTSSDNPGDSLVEITKKDLFEDDTQEKTDTVEESTLKGNCKYY